MTRDRRPSRLAIGPTDLAGTSWALRVGFEALDVPCDVALWSPPPTGFPAGRVLARGERARFGLTLPARADVVHFQYGSTWLPRFADAYLARARGRTLVAQYYGDDCRLHSVAARQFPARAPFVDPARERWVRRRIRRLARAVHAAVTADLELATYLMPFYELIYVVPLPLHPNEPAPPPREPRPTERPPVVLHAPTDRAAKGSDAISEAVGAVGARVPLEYRVVAGVPYAQVAIEVADADVVVDQLNSVTLGVFALEALRAGKVVLGQYEHAALAPYQRDFPAVRVTAATLARELERVVADPGLRSDLAARGPAYVAATHDPVDVARAFLRVYEHARGGEDGLFEATSAGVRRLDPGVVGA